MFSEASFFPEKTGLPHTLPVQQSTSQGFCVFMFFGAMAFMMCLEHSVGHLGSV